MLVVLPALAYAAVTVASGGNPLGSRATTSASVPAADPSASTEPTAGETPSASAEPTPTTPAADLGRAVEVRNATRTSGLASGAKSVLAAAGFTTVTTGNFAGTAPSASVVYYPTPADAGTAAAVAAALKITTVTESATTFPGGVLAVLAADYTP